MNRLQLTLAILKPDVVVQPHILKIIYNEIIAEDFLLVRNCRFRLTRKCAEEFYKEHEGRFFHNRLVTYMSSGPIQVHIMARHNAIEHWRKLMGPTKVYRTQFEDPTSIRGRFGLSDTRNCTHGSDSPESAAKEINFFFPDFDIRNWYEEKEPLFNEGLVKYVPELGIHVEHEGLDKRCSNTTVEKNIPREAS